MPQSLNDQNLDQYLSNAKVPVFLYFWAPWSRPCRNLDPAFDELMKTLAGEVVGIRINVDENAHAPVQYGVKRLPHLTLVREGRTVETLDGRHPLSQFREFVQKHSLGT